MIMTKLRQSLSELRWYEILMFFVMLIIGFYYILMDTKHPLWYLIINYISSICGVCCIFLTAHANYYSWSFALINTLCFSIILWYNKVYGTLALEIFYYIPTTIIGFKSWVRHLEDKESLHCKAKRLNFLQIIIMFFILGCCTVILHEILVYLGGATAWLDSMMVSIGLIAVIYEIKRIGDQYLLWILTDIIAVIQWIILFDLIMITKKMIYLIMAFIGLYLWRKRSLEYNEQNI